MFGLSKTLTGIVGVLALVGVALLYNTWENFNVARDAKAEVRAEAAKRAIELIQERGADDAKLSQMSDAELCRRLGFNWMPDTNSCN